MCVFDLRRICHRNKGLKPQRGFINTITPLYLKGADQISNKMVEMAEMLGVSSCCHHGQMEDVGKQGREKGPIPNHPLDPPHP